jgi:hypothetical protein
MKDLGFILIGLVARSCTGGLEPPPPVTPGFGGTVYTVHDSWPASDSLVGLWIFASQDYPIDSSKVFAGILLSPFRIYLYPSLTVSLPFYQDSIPYRFTIPPETYKYVGVIQQIQSGLNIGNFVVVAVLTDPGDTTQPRTLTITNESSINGIDFHIDFHHLPPQPFQ